MRSNGSLTVGCATGARADAAGGGKGGSGLASCGVGADGRPVVVGEPARPDVLEGTEPAGVGYGAIRWHYRHSMWPPFTVKECLCAEC